MSAPSITGDRVTTGRWSYRTSPSGDTVVVTTPTASPDLWTDYLTRVERSYAAHGVEGVLDLDRIRDGRSTSLFFVGFGVDGEMVGGVRTEGPYLRPEEAHALAEWDRDPAQPRARAMLAERLPFGVVEVKATWVARDFPRRRELAGCLARAPLHAGMILGARFVLATSAVHALPMWMATGAVLAPGLSAIGYPDDRYRTRMVWWDRWALPATVTEAERRTVDLEAAALLAPVASAA